MSRPDFWEDQEEAQEIQRRRSRLADELAEAEGLIEAVEEAETLVELADEGEQIEEDFGAALDKLENLVRERELQMMLSGEDDRNNAIFTIHPGAGGTESQDWAEILLRMYLRWCERRGFEKRVVEYQPGEEAGIKSVTVTVAGDYAYGYLKAESGVHRLVRISPFDQAKRRHTSFASVFVLPEIDDTIEVEIEEKDLRIDTFRSSGAGGQHVNVTDSAVRITHMPTGIVATCQNERSQHKNRATAMKILRARLYEHARREQEEKMAALEGSKKDIAWGSQIRSYVLHPYRMVKDHRTGLEVGNVDRILDGDLEDFIEAELLRRNKE